MCSPHLRGAESGGWAFRNVPQENETYPGLCDDGDHPSPVIGPDCSLGIFARCIFIRSASDFQILRICETPPRSFLCRCIRRVIGFRTVSKAGGGGWAFLNVTKEHYKYPGLCYDGELREARRNALRLYFVRN